MLDHMTFRVADMARSCTFYAQALAPWGDQMAHDAVYDGVRVVGLGSGEAIDTGWVDGPSPHGGPAVTSGCHLAWRAPNRAAVDAFYRAALAHGGRDNGPPGLRPLYHPHDCGAFVIDPDGNNVEAVCHNPA